MTEHPDILLRMQQQTRQWIAAGDKRAIFLECYGLMTANMLSAIAAGRFYDNLWARQLLMRFADYYFAALERYNQREATCAAVWEHTHQCACGRELHVLQHLLLGINAHINYDLVLSLVDQLEPEWNHLSQADQLHRYEDHCRVNEIIAATIDTVQDQVVARYDPRMDLLDRWLGRLDERLLSRLISSWRQEVWEQAIHFLNTAPGQREALRQALETSVMQRAHRMLII